jgi:hypothetical protein
MVPKRRGVESAVPPSIGIGPAARETVLALVTQHPAAFEIRQRRKGRVRGLQFIPVNIIDGFVLQN